MKDTAFNKLSTSIVSLNIFCILIDCLLKTNPLRTSRFMERSSMPRKRLTVMSGSPRRPRGFCVHQVSTVYWRTLSETNHNYFSDYKNIESVTSYGVVNLSKCNMMSYRVSFCYFSGVHNFVGGHNGHPYRQHHHR